MNSGKDKNIIILVDLSFKIPYNMKNIQLFFSWIQRDSVWFFDRMIIAQVFLKQATIKGHSKMCSFITQCNATDVACFEEACNWLAVCRNVHQSFCHELNVNFSTISSLQGLFIEFGSTSNRPHNRRPLVTTPAQNHHIQHLHLQDRLRPATRTAAATYGLLNQRISAQTVRNHLREAHLHACRPHQGLDLTAIRHRNWLKWANAHIRWHLALWRGVLFTDESRFSLYRADGSVENSVLLKCRNSEEKTRRLRIRSSAEFLYSMTCVVICSHRRSHLKSFLQGIFIVRIGRGTFF